MVRSVRNLMVGAFVAVAMLAMNSSTAEATFGSWGSWGSSGGSYGSWGSSGGSYGSWGSSGGSYGSWGSSGGPIRRLVHRIRAHRHYHYSSGGSYGSWGSSGGSYGSWGSSGGSYGSWGSSGGSHGSHGAVHVYHEGAAPAQQGEVEVYDMNEQPADQGNGDNPPQPPAETPEASPQAGYAPDAQSVLLSVELPAEAKVFVNGKPTTSTGPMRTFVSRNLETGRKYAYEVRAELEIDGQKITRTKLVRLPAGRSVNLDFDFDPSQVVRRTDDSRKVTKLILNVPAEAKVILAGQPTQSSGERREFSTSRLTSGQWADYPVRVELNRDGQTLVREAKISLAAGDTRELTIDFDTPQVASTQADTAR